MATLPVSGSAVAPVQIIEQFTAPAGEAITAGQVVRYNGDNGKFMLAGGTTAAGVAGPRYVAIHTANVANIAITAVAKGLIDLGGSALDGIAFGGTVFVGNAAGALDSAAGSVSVVAGYVVPGFAAGTAADRLLRVNF